MFMKFENVINFFVIEIIILDPDDNESWTCKTNIKHLYEVGLAVSSYS